MTAAAAALTAYANTDATQLAGGGIQLLNAAGNVVAGVAFNVGAAGTVAGAVMTAAGMPKTATAIGAGPVASARMRTAGGVDYHTGLTVGIPGSGAQVIVDNGAGTLAVAIGDQVTVLSATISFANGT